MTVSFVDTTVLCNLLPVPDRAQHRQEVIDEMRAKQRAGEVFILPVTTVVETGNFIAQLGNGHARRTTAERFVDLLELVVSGRAPWQLHQFEWGAEFIRSLVGGAGTGVSLVDHAANKVGGGDLCILAEREIYRRRTGIAAVRIWTRDAQLAAHD